MIPTTYRNGKGLPRGVSGLARVTRSKFEFVTKSRLAKLQALLTGKRWRSTVPFAARRQRPRLRHTLGLH